MLALRSITPLISEVDGPADDSPIKVAVSGTTYESSSLVFFYLGEQKSFIGSNDEAMGNFANKVPYDAIGIFH
jgi:hypothetical protein